MLAYVTSDGPGEVAQRRPLAAHVASLAGVVLLVFTFLHHIPTDRFPGWWAALPVLGSALIIAAGPGALLNRRLLSVRPVVLVGLISFPLYLWHFPLLVFARTHSGTQSLAVSQRLAVLGIATALAYLTYRLVELPVRSRTRRPGSRGIRFLVPAMAGAGALGLAVFALSGIPGRFPAQIRKVLAFTYDYKTAWRVGSCFLLPEQGSKALGQDCVGRGPGKLVVVWGDSHAI